MLAALLPWPRSQYAIRREGYVCWLCVQVLERPSGLGRLPPGAAAMHAPPSVQCLLPDDRVADIIVPLQAEFLGTLLLQVIAASTGGQLLRS